MIKYDIQIKNLPQIRAALKRYPEKMTKNLNKAIHKSGILFRARAGQKAPKKTTFLARTHELVMGNLKAEVFPTAKYALFVHEGTKPYVIYPVNKKALFWKGAEYPVRRVNHPGIKAQPWLKWTIQDTEPQIQRFFEDAVKDTFDEVGRGV